MHVSHEPGLFSLARLEASPRCECVATGKCSSGCFLSGKQGMLTSVLRLVYPGKHTTGCVTILCRGNYVLLLGSCYEVDVSIAKRLWVSRLSTQPWLPTADFYCSTRGSFVGKVGKHWLPVFLSLITGISVILWFTRWSEVGSFWVCCEAP